ncbi:MAG: hypothetical protein ACTSQY_01115 [Candidatus Odinarchaeia archaeon]
MKTLVGEKYVNPKNIDDVLFIRKHIPIKVKITENIEKDVAKELELERTQKGAELNIPWWKAKILSEQNLIEIIETQEIDQAYIQKIVWSEKSKPQLSEIDKTFYLRLAQKLNKLKEENKVKPNPILIKQIEDLEIPLNDLLSTRITKILKMAYRGAPPRSLEALTSEERWLYEVINEIIKKWIEKILGD